MQSYDGIMQDIVRLAGDSGQLLEFIGDEGKVYFLLGEDYAGNINSISTGLTSVAHPQSLSFRRLVGIIEASKDHKVKFELMKPLFEEFSKLNGTTISVVSNVSNSEETFSAEAYPIQVIPSVFKCFVPGCEFFTEICHSAFLL